MLILQQVSDVLFQTHIEQKREFLKDVIKEYEFEIKSIQIDGGSGFMGEFEDYCEELGIKW